MVIMVLFFRLIRILIQRLLMRMKSLLRYHRKECAGMSRFYGRHYDSVL